MIRSFMIKKFAPEAAKPVPAPPVRTFHAHLGRAILEEILPLYTERLHFYTKYAELVLDAEKRATPSVVNTVFSYLLTPQEYEDVLENEECFEHIAAFLNTL
jgi:hypothetical protein